MLEYMLQGSVIYFGGQWDQHLTLFEFAYNNSYYSSADISPFKTLYETRCKSQIGWLDTFEVRPWDSDMLKESMNKERFILDNFIVA